MTPEERVDHLLTVCKVTSHDRYNGLFCRECGHDAERDIAAAIHAAVEEEREACAKVADTVAYNWGLHHSVAPAAAREAAKAIRARGKA